MTYVELAIKSFRLGKWIRTVVKTVKVARMIKVRQKKKKSKESGFWKAMKGN